MAIECNGRRQFAAFLFTVSLIATNLSALPPIVQVALTGPILALTVRGIQTVSATLYL